MSLCIRQWFVTLSTGRECHNGGTLLNSRSKDIWQNNLITIKNESDVTLMEHYSNWQRGITSPAPGLEHRSSRWLPETTGSDCLMVPRLGRDGAPAGSPVRDCSANTIIVVPSTQCGVCGDRTLCLLCWWHKHDEMFTTYLTSHAMLFFFSTHIYIRAPSTMTIPRMHGDIRLFDRNAHLFSVIYLQLSRKRQRRAYPWVIGDVRKAVMFN